ncbi:MAG: hypothetical protein K2K34_09645, partial [Oscillospiraceae bacterium]|nr:hypothetical protein [Oscillospiraceae bacterium]
MKKLIKRISAAALAAITVLSLAACEKNTDGNDTQTASEEYAYRAASAELNEEITGDYDEFAYYGDKIYFTSMKYPERNGEGVDAYLNIVNADGSGFKSVQLCSREDNAGVSETIFTPDGNGYYVHMSDTEEKTNCVLKTIDENGTETGSVDITAAMEKYFLNGLYVSRFGVDGSGNFYITDYSDIIVLDRDGNPKGFISVGNGIQAFVTDKNGDMYIWVWTGSSYELNKLDIPDGVSEDKPQAVDMPFEGYNNHIISGNGVDTDFYVYDNEALYSWNIGEEPQKLLDWVKAGVSVIEASDVFYAGNDTFVCAGKSFPYEYPKFSKLTKQLVSTGDKKEIILAGDEYSISS